MGLNLSVAVEGRATLAAHHLLGLQEIPAHLQALSASSGRPNHAAIGLIRQQTKHKAVGIDRRKRGGRFQLLYLGLTHSSCYSIGNFHPLQL